LTLEGKLVLNKAKLTISCRALNMPQSICKDEALRNRYCNGIYKIIVRARLPYKTPVSVEEIVPPCLASAFEMAMTHHQSYTTYRHFSSSLESL